ERNRFPSFSPFDFPDHTTAVIAASSTDDSGIPSQDLAVLLEVDGVLVDAYHGNRIAFNKGMSKGAIAGIVVGGAFGILLLALILYVVFYRRKKVAQVTLLPVPGCGSSLDKASESTTIASPRLTGITVDKSVEFSYEELAKATDGFSAENIIGRGGFGSVYYAELRNEVCVFKIYFKMEIQFISSN
ncbi:hypothetical protein RYX36_020792, partial [Vicia faba]